MKAFNPAILVATAALSTDALAQRRSDNTGVHGQFPAPRVVITPGPSSRMSLPGRPGGRSIPHYYYPAPRPPKPCPIPPPCPPPPRHCDDSGWSGSDGANFNTRRVSYSEGIHAQVSGGSNSLRFQLSLNNFNSHRSNSRDCTPPVIGDRPSACVPVGWCSPYWSYFPSYYESTYGYSNAVVGAAYASYADPALSPQYFPPAPAAAPAPAEAQQTALEAATEFMQSARYADAARAFKDHLKSQSDDNEALRNYGVALLLAGKTRDGIDAVGKAYAADPGLSDRPIDTDELAITPTQLRELSGPVITMSRRLASANGFVTAAMLMQSRDRADLAKKMLDDAKASGLDRELYAKLVAAMGK